MFEDDILPEIGHMKMEEVEPMILLRVVRKFEERGAMERANKARRDVVRFSATPSLLAGLSIILRLTWLMR